MEDLRRMKAEELIDHYLKVSGTDHCLGELKLVRYELLRRLNQGEKAAAYQRRWEGREVALEELYVLCSRFDSHEITGAYFRELCTKALKRIEETADAKANEHR